MFEFNNTVTLEFIGRNLLVPKMDKLPERISVPPAKLYSEQCSPPTQTHRCLPPLGEGSFSEWLLRSSTPNPTKGPQSQFRTCHDICPGGSLAPMISRGARRQAGCRDEPKSTQLFFLDLELRPPSDCSQGLLAGPHPKQCRRLLSVPPPLAGGGCGRQGYFSAGSCF